MNEPIRSSLPDPLVTFVSLTEYTKLPLPEASASLPPPPPNGPLSGLAAANPITVCDEGLEVKVQVPPRMWVRVLYRPHQEDQNGDVKTWTAHQTRNKKVFADFVVLDDKRGLNDATWRCVELEEEVFMRQESLHVTLSICGLRNASLYDVKVGHLRGLELCTCTNV